MSQVMQALAERVEGGGRSEVEAGAAWTCLRLTTIKLKTRREQELGGKS